MVSVFFCKDTFFFYKDNDFVGNFVPLNFVKYRIKAIHFLSYLDKSVVKQHFYLDKSVI